MVGVPAHPGEDLDGGADGADGAERAGGRAGRAGARAASALAAALVSSSGPTRWPPQRSCSFVAGSPVS